MLATLFAVLCDCKLHKQTRKWNICNKMSPMYITLSILPLSPFSASLWLLWLPRHNKLLSKTARVFSVHGKCQCQNVSHTPLLTWPTWRMRNFVLFTTLCLTRNSMCLVYYLCIGRREDCNWFLAYMPYNLSSQTIKCLIKINSLPQKLKSKFDLAKRR